MALTTVSSTSGTEHAASEVTTLLGRGSEFEGKLSFEGTVRIDGKLSGEIFTDDTLIIGEGAEVNAGKARRARRDRDSDVRTDAGGAVGGGQPAAFAGHRSVWLV